MQRAIYARILKFTGICALRIYLSICVCADARPRTQCLTRGSAAEAISGRGGLKIFPASFIRLFRSVHSETFGVRRLIASTSRLRALRYGVAGQSTAGAGHESRLRGTRNDTKELQFIQPARDTGGDCLIV